MKKNEMIIYFYLGGAVFFLMLFALFFSGLVNKNLNTKLDQQIKQLNNIRGENIILKARIDYEIQQKEIAYRMLDQKVFFLNDALARIYPGYDYRKKIDAAIDDNAKIESLPESLIEIYREQKYIIPHGLNNYQLSIPDIIWPVDPNTSFLAFKNSEYGTPRPYSYMKYKHEGIDIVCLYSDEVRAVHDAYVHRIYYTEGGGWSIEIKFFTGEYHCFFRYRHIERIFVKKNDKIKQGDIIALAGETGDFAKGKHIHLEAWIWKENYYQNINPVLNSTWGNKILTAIN